MYELFGQAEQRLPQICMSEHLNGTNDVETSPTLEINEINSAFQF